MDQHKNELKRGNVMALVIGIGLLLMLILLWAIT
jgi:hypothetical protein